MRIVNKILLIIISAGFLIIDNEKSFLVMEEIMARLKPSKDFGSFEEAVKEVFEQSDRSTAIVASALLENKLEKLISYFMNNDRLITRQDGTTLRDRIFYISGPLSTFAAKINLAYAFGWINDLESRDLHTICKIRDHFAHFFQKLTFSNQNTIKGLCRNLQLGRELTNSRNVNSHVCDDARQLFINATGDLMLRLILKTTPKET